MNLQQIFDNGVRGVIRQGGLSAYNGACKYRGPMGRKCAIGWSIPDDQYRVSLEGAISRELMDILSVDPKHYAALRGFQHCHDTVQAVGPTTFRTSFAARCRDFASAYALNTAALSETLAEVGLTLEAQP